MAGSQPSMDALREQRQKIADGGEPLNTEERKVRLIDGTLYINPTDYGARTHDISKGDDVEVHTTVDGIAITLVDEDGDDDGRR